MFKTIINIGQLKFPKDLLHTLGRFSTNANFWLELTAGHDATWFILPCANTRGLITTT